MTQQIEALRRMAGAEWFALFMEQGTGKTWAYLADAERYYLDGKIDAIFVLAPSGVHENWVLREIPLHMDCNYVAHFWRSGMGKRARAALARDLLTPNSENKLRIFTMNFEAMARSKEAFQFAVDFMQANRAIFVLDESQRIKNIKSATHKKVMEARPYARARRIGTGTPMDKPEDIFGQMQFLEPGLLGTSNYRAFMSEFAVIADASRTQPGSRELPIAEDWRLAAQIRENPRMAWSIQIARDEHTGLPMYRNLERLRKLIEPHAYRVLKKDCLDLPEKLYTNHYFELTPAQREAYELAEDELRVRSQDGTLTPIHKLSKFGKLQQITSGFVFVPGEPDPVYIGDRNPRLLAIMDRLEDLPGQKIIWARFREEISSLANLMRDSKIPFVEYHGGIGKNDRNEAIDKFQGGEAEVFLGVQKAGGVGLPLYAASNAMFCSNEFSALIRLQAEDRCHRKGSEIHESILYTDLVARDSIDESIARAHQFKMGLAACVLGDRGIDIRGINFDVN
jgi:SNF2 family DNA or RNA helicase